MPTCSVCTYNDTPSTLSANSCSLKHVIYLIECSRCHIQYIGSSKRSARTRIREHLIDIQQGTLKTHLVNHFTKATCSKEDLRFRVLQFGIQDLNPEKLVVNPEYRTLTHKLKKTTEKISRIEAQFYPLAEMIMELPIDEIPKITQKQADKSPD